MPPAVSFTRLNRELGWLASVLLAAALVAHGIRDAWIEDRLARVGLPLPGTLMPTVGTLEATTLGLDECARRPGRRGQAST